MPEREFLFHENEQTFYFYNQKYWQIIDDSNIKTGAMARLLTKYLINNYPQINIQSNTVSELKYFLTKTIENVYDKPELTPYTAFEDCVLDLTTLETFPHSPELLAFHYLPIPFPKVEQPTPVFDYFLECAFPGNEEMKNLLYEMLGFYLSPSPAGFTFFIYGAAAAGKSQLLELIKILIGKQFYSGVSLQSLTNSSFSVAGLLGKRVNIKDEDESEYIKSDKLKALIDHRTIQAEKKFSQPFDFEPFTKFLFASNQLPKFKMVDDGLLRKLIFVEFKNPIPPERRDIHLLNKLKAELPGIIYKALQGMRRFYDNGERFVLPKDCKDGEHSFLYTSLAAIQFFEDNYILTEKHREENQDLWTRNETLYNAYKDWSKENGKTPLNSMNFFKQLLDNIPELKTRAFHDGRFKNCYPRSVPNYADSSKMIPF